MGECRDTAGVVSVPYAIASLEQECGAATAVVYVYAAEATITAEQGPAGPAGRNGDTGAAGRDTATVVSQSAPSASWIIAHSYGRAVGVQVFDASGAEVLADVVSDPLRVSVTFASPTSGFVILS
ncbi:hypothetical protein FHR71_005640 [Methylobacterium sp. RAS18]|nr:hypothetical protein [Methylobacterium sp. RAS18]